MKNTLLQKKPVSRHLKFALALMLLITSVTTAFAVPPAITSHPTNKTACAGPTNIYMTVTATNATAYQWQVDAGSGFSNIFDGPTYTYTNTASLRINSVTSGMNNYRFRCVAIGPDNPPATSNSCTLTVNSFITIATQPASSITICAGQNTSLAITTTGTVTSYQWYGYNGTAYVPISNSGMYSGATSATLNITGATTAAYAAYYCYVSGPCNVTHNATTYLTVNTAPAITASPLSTTVCVGDVTYMNVTATGTALTYQWQYSTNGIQWFSVPDDATYDAPTTKSLLIRAHTGLNNMMYRCIVNGACTPSATSGNATLTVHSRVNITTNPTSKRTICAGSTTSFSVSATGSNLTYQWFHATGLNQWAAISNDAIYSGATNPTLVISNAPISFNGRIYRCRVMGGCSSMQYSGEGLLAVDALPDITQHPVSIATCPGNDIYFTSDGTGKNINYRWQIRSGSQWINLNNSGTYSGVTTNRLGVANVTTSLDNTQYRLVLSGTCSPADTSNVAELTVYGLDTPSVSITANFNNVCEGIALVFTATPVDGGSNPMYQWKVNNVNTGGPTVSNIFISNTLQDKDVISCAMTSNANCPVIPIAYSNTIDAIITTYKDPEISIASPTQNNRICSDVPVTFTSSTMYAGDNPGYQWQVNGINVPGANSANYVTDSLDHLDVVRCVVTTNYICPASLNGWSNNLQMDVVETTPATVMISSRADTTVCSNAEVKLFAYYTNSGINPQFQWFKNGSIIPNEKGPTYTSSLYAQNDIIKCRFTSSAECVMPVESAPLKFNVTPNVYPEVGVSVHHGGGTKHTFVAIPKNGGDNPTYDWYVNNVKQQGNGAMITIDNLHNGMQVYVVMHSNYPCRLADMATSKNITTGVDDVASAFNELKLYPNPNNGNFTLAGEYVTTGNQDVKVSIFNAVGQMIYTQVVKVNGGKLQHEINMNGKAAPGLYTIRLDADGKQDIRRFTIAQ